MRGIFAIIDKYNKEIGNKMQLINYRNTISIESNNKKNFIKTDTNDIFWLRSRKSITDWYRAQKPSEFRIIQKEQFLTLKDAINYENWDLKIEMYVGMKPDTQPNQPTDVAVMRVPKLDLWIVSTHQHTWFQITKLNQFDLQVADAYDSVQEKSTQEHIWTTRETARKRSER